MAKSLTNPVGSPVSGSTAAVPKGRSVRSRETPSRRMAAVFSQAVCTSYESTIAGVSPVTGSRSAAHGIRPPGMAE